MSESATDLLREAAEGLLPVAGGGAGAEARLLLTHATGQRADRAFPVGGDPVGTAAAGRFRGYVASRRRHQPVSQIIGTREFWKHAFTVTRDVLDPRPETEQIVELALRPPRPRRILDLGTGSGCVLGTLLAELPDATGLGTDVSYPALRVARRNIEELGVAGRADLRLSDWFRGVSGRFDLIACNPPYVAAHELASLAPEIGRWEPELALLGGDDGLENYRRIAPRLGAHLEPGGRALFETGAGQAGRVAGMLRDATGLPVRVFRDLDGRDRIVEVCGR